MKYENNLSILGKLIVLVKPLTGYMILAILLGIIGHLFAIFITVLGGYGLLNILIMTDIRLQLIFGLIAIFAVLRGVFHYGEQACNHYIAFKLLAHIRDRVFVSLRKLAPAKLETKDKGNLISIITSDIELLEVFYAHTISPIFIAIGTSIFMAVFISRFSIILSLVAILSYMVVGIAVPLIASKLSSDMALKSRNKSGELSSFILDGLRGLPEVLQFDKGEKIVGQIDEKTHELIKEEEKLKIRESIVSAITYGAIILCDGFMLITASSLYNRGIIGFNGVVISFIALTSSFGPTIALANLGIGLQKTLSSAKRVLDILEEEPITKEISSGIPCEFEELSIDNVVFSYGEETIIDDLSLDIKKDSIVGIVGKSGCGKSTLLRLIMRFWDVKSGEISISGRNLKDINTTDLRKMEGFVTQETHMFHDTIFNNVVIARLDAKKEEVEEACKKASIHDFIMGLPQGYNTLVGELGSTLSGGEKQRIGIARAFLHDSPLMLLDEPTSNLDTLNEAIILKSIKEQRENKTVILVSHRESTMGIADVVYNIENGRIS